MIRIAMQHFKLVHDHLGFFDILHVSDRELN